jgi:hypothetical protein
MLMPMFFATLPPNLQVTGLYVLAVLSLCAVMKLIAFRGRPESKDPALIFAPFPSPESAKRMLPLSAAPRLILRFLAALGACACAYWLYWNFLQGLPPVFRSYVGAIILWLVAETAGSFISLLSMPFGRLWPLPHGASPPLARSLSEFWGRRWNVWVSDLFRQIIFRPLQNRPILALVTVFLISGIFHELAINVPLYVVTGRNCFGSMILYFLLQAFGILIERRVRNRGVRVLFVWLFVFGAAPIFMNEGMLRILGLWVE